jgi:hypothetical protein
MLSFLIYPSKQSLGGTGVFIVLPAWNATTSSSTIIGQFGKFIPGNHAKAGAYYLAGIEKQKNRKLRGPIVPVACD